MIISGYSMNEATEDSILSDPFFGGKRTISVGRIDADALKVALKKYGFKHVSHVHYQANHSRDLLWIQFSNGKEYVSMKYVMVPEAKYTIKVSKSPAKQPTCPGYAEPYSGNDFMLSRWSIADLKAAGIY